MYEPTPLVPVPDPVLVLCELILLVLVALWKLDPDCLFANNKVVGNPFWGLLVLEFGYEFA